MFGLPVGQANSGVGSLVNAPPPGPTLPDQQFPPPSSSHQKSTPFGSRLPFGRKPIRLPTYWLLWEVS